MAFIKYFKINFIITIVLLLCNISSCFSQIDTSFYDDGSKRLWDFESSQRYYKGDVPVWGAVIIEFKDFNKFDSLIAEKIIYGLGHYKAVRYNENGKLIFEEYNNDNVPIFYQKIWDNNGLLQDEQIDLKGYSSKTTYYIDSNIKKIQKFEKYEFVEIGNGKTHTNPKDNLILLERNFDTQDTILKTTVIENYSSGRIKSVKHYTNKRVYRFQNEEQYRAFIKNINISNFDEIVIKYKSGIWQQFDETGKLISKKEHEENSNIWNLLVE